MRARGSKPGRSVCCRPARLDRHLHTGETGGKTGRGHGLTGRKPSTNIQTAGCGVSSGPKNTFRCKLGGVEGEGESEHASRSERETKRGKERQREIERQRDTER